MGALLASTGVVALALESGARLFCSNNMSFSEARRYYGNVFGSFDIGNYLEIAQKVQNETIDYTDQRDTAYRRYNIMNSVSVHRHIYEHKRLPNDLEIASMSQIQAMEATQ